MEIVNWDFLEQRLNSFKKNARSEVISPNDRTYLEQPQQQEKIDTSLDSPSHPGSDCLPNPARTLIQEEQSGEENYIEIENHRGKMKKIDPDDYSVEILAGDNIIFKGVLSKIGSGMYNIIRESYGSSQALNCLVKDYIKSPNLFSEPKLDFLKAKMILGSLQKMVGHVPNSSVEDILKHVDDNSQKSITEWLQKQKM